MTDRKRIVVLAASRAAFVQLTQTCSDTLGCVAVPVFRRGHDPSLLRSASAYEEKMTRYLELRLPAEQAQAAHDTLLATGLCESIQIVGPTRPAIACSHTPRRSIVSSVPFSTGRTPDLSTHQQYLRSGPNAMNIERAWARSDARGEGVQVVDIEWSWNFHHEDLQRVDLDVLLTPIGKDDKDHGTAVLGILGAHHDGRGVRGICPEARLRVTTGDSDDDGVWNAEAGIESALDTSRAGDVIVLEMHTPGPTHPGGDSDEGLVPVEYVEPTFDAIAYAVECGVIVVEAAGNGCMSLDDRALDGLFDRDTRDSGAILVGAGASSLDPNPRSRLPFSNYGQRLDVQGWGENVATTGGASKPYYYDLYSSAPPHIDANRCYTKSFMGTSSAAPLVAGVLALGVSALRRAGKRIPAPEDLCRALQQSATPQPPSQQRIGPLPDCVEFLSHLGVI